MSYLKGNIWCIVLCCLMLVPCRAQYHPTYSQYMFNGLAINPAYAGSRDALSLAALYRAQWIGFDGSPSTQTLAGDFPLRNPQIALGLLVYNDVVSIYRQTGFFAAYAFRVRLGEGRLSLGLQAGFEQMREDGTDIKTIDPGDIMFNHAVNKAFLPNVGFGAYYHTLQYFAGFSIPFLLSYDPVAADSYKASVHTENVKLYGGMIFSVNPNLKFRPSALLQYDQKSFLCDFNCNAIFMPDGLFEVGISYRNTKVLVAMAEVRVNRQLSLGYSYDHTFGLATGASGAHEVMLRYEFRYFIRAENPLYLK